MSKKNITPKFLSPLERDVLKILWMKKKAKVSEIYLILKKKRKVAHSSVAVILDRLHNKRLVKRDIETCRGGFRYTYSPSNKKEDYHKKVLDKAVNKLIDVFGSTAVSYFNERFGDR